MFSLGFTSSLGKAVESAARLARAASHNVVAPEHLLRAVFETPGSSARAILLGLAEHDLNAAWNATWPSGLSVPRALPPTGPAAQACLHFAAAAARLREASQVTTADLVDMILTLDDPGVEEFLERTGIGRDAFTSAHAGRLSHQERALTASFALPVARPAAGAVGGVVERNLVLPFEISERDGPIARALAITGRSATGPLDSVDILTALGLIDPLPMTPFRAVAVRASADPRRESGRVPVDLDDAQVQVTTHAAFALGAALMLRDCYRLPYVRHELIVAGLLLTAGSRVRRAFEDVLLCGLTTTRSHIEIVAGHSFGDLPAVVRSISHGLATVLPSPEHHPYVSLDDERWDPRDSDPLDVFTMLRQAFEADATERGALDVAVDRIRQGLGDATGDTGFRTIALHALWLGELARGDRGSSAEIARRLHHLATEDLWADRRQALASWLTRPAVPPSTTDDTVESRAAALLRTTGPEEVLQRLGAEHIRPDESLIAQMSLLREQGAPVTPFAASGLAEATLSLVAVQGLNQTRSALLSPRLRGRVAAATEKTPDATTLSSLLQDSVAESDYERSADLVRNLDSAAAPLDASAYESEVLRLCVTASEALGSDHEARYLVRLVGTQNLLASKAAEEEDRRAANELGRHGLSLLVTGRLCASTSARLVAPLATLLHQWWQAAAEIHREPRRGRTAGLLALRLAAAALPHKDEFASLLQGLRGSADAVTDRWIEQMASTLRIPLPPAERGHYMAPRVRATDPGALAQAVGAFNEAGSAAVRDTSLNALERLVAARDRLDRVAHLGDTDTIAMLHKCLLVVGRCTDAGAPLANVAGRLHGELVALTRRRVTEPGDNWGEVVEAWAKAAAVADIPELEVRRIQFHLTARAYERSSDDVERSARRPPLERAADAFSRHLLALGQHHAAAAVIEATADLGLRDRRSGWKPLSTEEQRIPVLSPPIGGTFYGNPFTHAFVRRRPEPVPDGERPGPWSRLLATPLSTPRPVLVVVPGRQGGHLLAIEDGECTGWPAPALDDELARDLIPRFSLDGGDRRAGIDALRKALPDDARAWVSRRREVAVLGRGWCALTPLHAALPSDPDAGDPVLSHTTSLARLSDSADAARTWQGPPKRAVLVSDPRPSTMAAVRISGGEYGALATVTPSVSLFRGPDAVRGAVLDAVASRPDVFHFGGPVHYLGLLLAYDTALAGSAVRDLTAGPTRVTVLAGGPTAFPDVRHDDGGLADAFGALGCPAVIGCLWQTDDLADSLLIDSFYRDAISSGWASPAASLRRAANWLRTATWSQCAERLAGLYGDPYPARPPDSPVPYADPRHWAGYVCFGT
ncbi:CHAT domain-containing protein [Streptomyces sp. NPDC051014]|uniref:CHAT domain-containing protein n=1 Tax=Streptomyces sp. NPDC051014 TaxID=3155751 RepID=UPI00340F1D24